MHPVQVAIAVAAAMVISAIAAAAGSFVFGRRGGRDVASFVGLGLAIATAILFVQQEGWPARNPSRGPLGLNPMWASYLVVAGALGALSTAVGLTDWFGRGRALRAIERAILVALVVAAALLGLLQLPEAGGLRPAHVAAMGAVPLILALAARLESDRGFATAASIAFSLAGAAVLVLESGFAKGALVVGAAGAAVGAVALVSCWRRVGLGLPAGATALGLLVAGLALGRAYESESAPAFPAWIWPLPAFAPLAALLGYLPALRERQRLRTAAVVGTTLLLVAIAVGCAFAIEPSSTTSEQDLSDLYR
jgi:hypothetical protein